METLGREQSALAEALLRAALDPLEAGLRRRYGTPEPEGFVVLGLGKLGGEDLNWSSDVDLVLVHRGDGTTGGGSAGALPTVTFYTRLAEAIARAMSTVTEDGFCYRVDLDLRPQGRAGAAVASLPAMLQYYEQHGRTWERAAWVKARPIAGDLGLGQQLLDGLGPFLWRRTLDLAAVESLRDLKMQIDLRSTAREGDVKLGPGGIREVEFIAVALQLLHGGRNPTLRVRSTQRALRRLVEAGLLSQADADRLLEAYVFLRRVENRLQMVNDRQTQGLPPPGPERDRLALTMGFTGPAALEAELDRHRSYVAQAFHILLGREARGELPHEPELILALDDDLNDATRGEALARRGFDDGPAALGSVQRLRRVLGAARLRGGPRTVGHRAAAAPGCRAQPGPRPGALLPRRVCLGPLGTGGLPPALAPAPRGGPPPARPVRPERVPERGARPDSRAARPAGVLGRRGTAQAAGAHPLASSMAGRLAPPTTRSSSSAPCAASRTRRCCASVWATSPESSTSRRWHGS